MQLTYQDALVLDLSTVAVCIVAALRCASSLLHPATVMLGAHCYIVTLRLWQLARGFKPMAYSFAWPLSEGEIVRASIASDAALIAIAVGWLTVHYWGPRGVRVPVEPRIRLSDRRVHLFAACALCLGAIGFAILGPHAEAGHGVSGYLVSTTEWVGWCFCLLHFRYGLTWPLLAVTIPTMAIVMLLITFRGAVIIPCVFLLFTWLARRNSTSPPWALVPAAVCIWLAWLPMKPIVYGIQSGESIPDAIQVGVTSAFAHFGQDNGSGIDFQFLDMVSSTMTLVDIHQSYFYGSTLAPLVVGLYPRQLWPEKPQFNQYQHELDIPSRAMAKLNMTAGLVGESYANFGYLGAILIPFGVSVALSVAYKRIEGTSLLTPGCMLYVLFTSTYMQLYRDGLVAAILFPFVHCAPMGVAAISHWIWPPRDQRESADSGDYAWTASSQHRPCLDPESEA